MNRIANFITAVALSGAILLFAIPVFAQVPGASTSGQAASVGTEVIPGPKLAEVESALAAIEADTGIEDAVKNQLRSKYTQAIDALKESADFLTKAADYRGAIEAAPNEAAIARDQRKPSRRPIAPLRFLRQAISRIFRRISICGGPHSTG